MKKFIAFTFCSLLFFAGYANASTINSGVYCDSPNSYSEMATAGVKPQDKKTLSKLFYSDECMVNEKSREIEIIKKGKSMASFRFNDDDTETTFYTSPIFIE